MAAGLAGDRWWRQLVGGGSRASAVPRPSRLPAWSGGAAPLAKLVVFAALALRCDLILGVRLQVGGEKAAGEVRCRPDVGAGPRSSSRRVRVLSGGNHRAPACGC